METLSERIEVRVSRSTLRLVRAEARARDVSVGELVREAIARIVQEESAARIQAAHSLFEVEAPVADWAVIEREIEQARAAQPDG
jgi:hypothetical protein